MKTIAAIVLLSCCALARDKSAISRAEVGCGPQDVKYEVKSSESQHPTPPPEDGKALIYVVADGDLTSIFGVDGKWVGAVSRGKYFFVPIDPGEHHVCAMLQSSSKGLRVRAVHSLRQSQAELIISGLAWSGSAPGSFFN